MSGFVKPAGAADACTAEPVSLACTVRSRLRGLLGCDGAQGILVLAPCHSIHTFGMRFPIDVAFVSADGSVLDVHRNVGMRRRLHCRDAVATFEREAATDAPWFEVGQRIWVKGAPIGSGASVCGICSADVEAELCSTGVRVDKE